jgi:hypothetical protein
MALVEDSELLSELESRSDLAALVRRVRQTELPWVVVSSAAVTAWEGRDPAAWAKVARWLATNGVTLVRL